MLSIAQRKESPHLPGVISAGQTRAARALLGWSQADLAEKAGVGRSTVDKLERGTGRPKAEFVAAIQRAIEAAGVYPIPEDQWGGEGVRKAK